MRHGNVSLQILVSAQLRKGLLQHPFACLYLEPIQGQGQICSQLPPFLVLFKGGCMYGEMRISVNKHDLLSL